MVAANLGAKFATMQSMKRKKAKTRSPLKTKPLRLPGQSLQEEEAQIIEQDLVLLTLVGMGMLYMLIYTWIPFLFPQKTYLSSIAFLTITSLVVLGYVFYKGIRLRKKLLRIRQGRDGELIVAEHLEVLREEGCYIIHDFIGQDFNIDHIVIAPQGVFCIETKTMSKPTDKDLKIDYYGDSIKVAGKEVRGNVLQQVQAQADYLKNYLKEALGEDIFIRPVVAYPGWFINLRAKKPHIWVLEPKAIPKFMRNEPTRLDNSKINMIKQALRINMQKS